MKQLLFLALICWFSFFQNSFAQIVGKKLPSWTAGELDIHHINTGRGNATFMLLPDGTSFMVDAGALDPTYRELLMRNYKSFVKSKLVNNTIIFEKSIPGSNTQIVLKKDAKKYQSVFEIRNIISNGELWTGKDANTKKLFPELSTLRSDHYPSENMCSIGIRLSYGRFDYFSGGDMPGVLGFGSPPWNDIETPVSRVVGPVEALILNHHGNRDAQNDRLLAALRPQVMVIPVWSSDHPGHDVLDRMLSDKIYTGPRAIFATDMLEANKLVIGEMLNKLKSDSGHILIRVSDSGIDFKVIILDDTNENLIVKAIFGPYQSE